MTVDIFVLRERLNLVRVVVAVGKFASTDSIPSYD